MKRLGLLIAAFVAVAVAGALAQPAAPLQFTFDDGFASTPGLEFHFSRPVPTVDFAGRPVAAGQWRPVAASTLAAPPQTLSVRPTNSGLHILASGLDHDGLTPLLVVFQTAPPSLDVFTVAGDDLLNAEATGIGRIRTKLKSGADLLRGAYPGKRYVANAGAVCYGLIVILCDVYGMNQLGAWVLDSTGFVASQDQGRTWTLLYDGGPVQAGHNRGREWCMANWWPMNEDTDPLVAWFCGTDYRSNPGSTGGRAFLFRATRPEVGQAWAVEPVARIYEQEGTIGEHFHVGAVLPYGDQGIRAIISIGDGQPNNRIVSLSRDDQDYLNPQGWALDETYHGSKGSPGTWGNQFVGCAPFRGGALVGGDLDHEQIMRLTCDPFQPHPETSLVYGLGSAIAGNDASVFLIRTPTPQVPDSPYVASFKIGVQKAPPGALYSRRLLFSPDGERWTQAINPESTEPLTLALHGADIYFNRSAPPKGLFRTPVPRCITRRPLLVGPGGLQRLVPDPVLITQQGGTTTRLQRTPAGVWLDGGAPIDPPPIAGGAVYRITTSKNAPSKAIATIRPAGKALDFGDVVGTNAVAARCWIRNLDPGTGAKPRLTLRDSAKTTQKHDDTRINATDRWIPITPTYVVPVGPAARLELAVAAAPTANDEDFYLAMDSFVEGAGMVGYPMPPDQSMPPHGTLNPDELASVSGLACTPAWTVTLAGEVPQDGFDASITSVTRWPLAAVWADSANYIQLIADTLRRRLVIEIYRDGALAGSLDSSEVYWLRGSSVLVSLAEGGAGIQASCSVGSLPVRVAAPSPGYQTASLNGAPTEVRFGDASGLSGDGIHLRQSPMQWWGGQIDTDTARPVQERAAMLNTLSFLDLPPGRPGCRADLDRDGELTLFDVLFFFGLFASGDAGADFDRTTGDGVFDLLDAAAFGTAFAEGCK